jgi:hypothetical protein
LKKISLEVLPGNLFGVFEKVEEDVPVSDEISENYELARTMLGEGRQSYWMLPNTYLKVPRRLKQRAREMLVSSSLREPRKILNHLFEKDEQLLLMRAQ